MAPLSKTQMLCKTPLTERLVSQGVGKEGKLSLAHSRKLSRKWEMTSLRLLLVSPSGLVWESLLSSLAFCSVSGAEDGEWGRFSPRRPEVWCQESSRARLQHMNFLTMGK